MSNERRVVRNRIECPREQNSGAATRERFLETRTPAEQEIKRMLKYKLIQELMQNRRWRKRWFSGAYDRETVFRRSYAAAIRQVQKAEEKQCGDVWYFSHDNPEDIERGKRLRSWSISGRDIAASVAQELRIPWRAYRKIHRSLFGMNPGAQED